MLDRLRTWFEKFAPLSGAAWAALVPHVRPRTLARHETFVQPGDQPLALGFLLSGTARQFYRLPDGTERTTYFFFQHDALADYRACVLGQPAALTIEALAPCALLTFPYAALLRLYDDFPAWERVGRRIAEYVAAGLEARLVETLTLTPEARYRLLVATPARHKLLEQVPQHLLAAYLGVTPVSLSRIRRRVAGGVS